MFLDFLPLILAFALLFMGMPMAVALFSASFVYFAFITDIMPLTMIVQRMVSSTMTQGNLSLPLYVLVGVVMSHTGLAERLMDFCNTLVGHMRGGLAQVNVLLSMFNGGVSGSSNADAAYECKILVPEMTKQGYPLNFSAAVTAASGLIAGVIPPAGQLIQYGIITGTSIGALFMAGYVPGVLLTVFQMLVVAYMAKKYNFARGRDKRATLKEIWAAFKKGFWALAVAATLIIGLRFGLFTVTEGATVMSIMCLLVGFFAFKNLKLKDLLPMFKEAAHSSCAIMLMISSSMTFGLYLSCAGIPQAIAEFFIAMSATKTLFLLMSVILLFIVGMFLNGNAVMLIMAPILYPVAVKLGISPVFFGIFMIINTSIGAMTPPVGGVMFTVCNLLKLSIVDFQKAIWPFIACFIAVILLMILFPDFFLLIPRAVFGVV